jgi:hypothetical protein
MKNLLFLLFFTSYYIQSFTQNNSVSYLGGQVHGSYLDEYYEPIEGSLLIYSNYGSTIKYDAKTDTYTFDIYFDSESKYLRQQIYSYDYTNNIGDKIYRYLNTNDPTKSYYVIVDNLIENGNLMIMSNNLIKLDGRFVYSTTIFTDFKTN